MLVDIHLTNNLAFAARTPSRYRRQLFTGRRAQKSISRLRFDSSMTSFTRSGRGVLSGPAASRPGRALVLCHVDPRLPHVLERVEPLLACLRPFPAASIRRMATGRYARRRNFPRHDGSSSGWKARKATDGGLLADFQSGQTRPGAAQWGKSQRNHRFGPKFPEPGLQIKGFDLLHCMAAFGIGWPGGALRARLLFCDAGVAQG